MKDFQLRNDTKLLFRNNPVKDLKEYVNKKKVLFVYGGGSVKRNGCYNDVKKAIDESDGKLFELSGASREITAIEKGIQLVEDNNIEMIIGAGGASIMDCAKLIAFGSYHKDDLWDYIKGRKNPYGLEKLPLILIPTYPSSGSGYGLGAVASDKRRQDFGTAYGIGDHNPISYDMGISVIKNVLKATKSLKENPNDEGARGVILYGASISTSGRLGLGKEENYAYDIYELEFIPEILFEATYRKSLTTLFPRFLKVMAKYYQEDIVRYFKDIFGYEEIEIASKEMIKLFEDLGVDMYFKGQITRDKIENIDFETILSIEEVTSIIEDCLVK